MWLRASCEFAFDIEAFCVMSRIIFCNINPMRYPQR